MSEIEKVATVEPILFGVVKVRWHDGFEAVVDLRPVISQGEMFQFLRDRPDHFATVRHDDHGHTIYWLDDDGDEIEFGSDALRRRAVRQAEILRLAS